jgi:hypothetical protein
VFAVYGKQKNSISESWIQEQLERFSSTDDVFQPAFLQGVIFYGAAGDELEITNEARNLLATKGMQWLSCVSGATTDSPACSDPYFMLDGRLREVWRLCK